MENNNVKLSFAAINPFEVDNIINPTEKEYSGLGYVQYGDANLFPSYIYDLYLGTPTLQSAINSLTDYVCGENINSKWDMANENDTIEDFFRYIALDYVLFGACAINVVRNKLGCVCALYRLDVRNVRSDKKNTEFWYGEFNKKWSRVKTVKYPKYDANVNAPNSILYIKNGNLQTYGLPMWCAATRAVEMEKRINDYNLNNIINGFSSSYIVNLNGGIPDDELKVEIEKNFNEKFCGSENSGRLVIAYNNDKDHAATIEAIPEDNVHNKFNDTVKWAREQILFAFRAPAQILGVALDNKGFNDSDFGEAFALFSKTVVLPIQKKLVRTLNTNFDLDLTVEPFNIKFNDSANTNNDTVKDE